MEENKKKKRKLKKPVKIALGIIMFFISAVLVGILLFNFLLGPVSNESKEVLFEVESGSSVYSVGEKLKEEGLIKNYIAYKIYVRLNGVNEYKAGIYKLDKSYSTEHIIELLTGDYYERNGITITFKEGITIRDVAKEISSQTTISESEFYAVLEHDAYIDSLIEKY